MRHEPNTNGNCAECSQLRYGNGKRRVEPWPCPVVLLIRERAMNATLRERVMAAEATGALLVEETRGELEYLRAAIALAERRGVRPVANLVDLMRATASRCIDMMEARPGI